MMATVPLSSSSLLPLLGTLEDVAAGVSEQTDAYLTIANRLSGEDGRQFFPIIVKHFSRLGQAFQTHISSENEELRQAALQALGFCVFNTNIVSSIPATFAEEILLALCALVLKSTDKNTCTRALWVISKQNFPADVISKKTPEILKTLEAMQTKDMQSVLMDHESLNVVIKLLEQAPSQMGEGAVCWAKLVIPLVVHSASKVRLRAAAALEMGMPLLLEEQQEVAAIVEPMMSVKLIPEMQKLFSAKNESNVLKLWPLFVKLLGKLLHKGGAFINSLLYLEELGFRSSSPAIKKIAFIAWKSLIDNFALNPDILCNSKRLKLLMQPLSSILVRTEALLLTKVEVWWYLAVKLGPSLATNFDQVGIPLLQSTLSSDASQMPPATPARNTSQTNGIGLATPKPGVSACSSPGSTSRLSLNSSVSVPQSYSSIQLLGLEMLLHYFLGLQACPTAAKSKLQLSLEPLTHNLLSNSPFFSKHSAVFISAVRDGFIAVGKDAPEALLNLIWSSLVNHVSIAIEAAGNKKERQGSEVLTLLLQAFQSILSSEALPAPRALVLLETTVKGIPQKVLGSAAYQVANMDVLNGTPALFLILLFYNNSLLSVFVSDERFFLCLETLVCCGLSGPTSPLAFGEAVLGAVSRSVESVQNKEHLWRMWSVVVQPLTDTITQTNEVNQGDALEHNFSAIHSALMFPITHLLSGSGFPQMTQKSMLSSWSRLYKAFARCSALVATADENVCCEELCSKISAALDNQALKSLSTLDAIANILLSIIESVDFTPFTPQFQQKMKSPHTPLGWVRKRSKALGNLSSFHVLLVQSLEAFLTLVPSEENSTVLSGVGTMLISSLSTIFTNLALPTVIQASLGSLTKPLAQLYGQAGSETEQSKSITMLGSKLEKLVGDLLGSLQTRSALQYDDELLEVLSPLLCVFLPHKSKQIRTVVTQFWNATFGNALVLTYPEMIRPVLSQAKMKAPLILPGFQAVETSEDFSGQCSNECSQIDIQISGIKVTSVGKRESLLRAAELKERNSGTTSKPVSVKLDFGSPKPPQKEVLEEEASVDFVFIPPEAKERVLTEHQKEVKRTKRVDIPAMYNNLDASLDTTAFSQYSQSQEESMDKLPTHEPAETKEEDKPESMDITNEQSPVVDAEKVQDDDDSETAAKEKEMETSNKTTEVPSSADITMADADDHQDSHHKESQSPNVSGSSDVISGTPPKSASRRQSFITLEKYVEGQHTSSPDVTKFTGPLTRTSGPDSPKPQDEVNSASNDLNLQPESDNESTVKVTQLSTNENEDKSSEKDQKVKLLTKCPSEGTDEDEVIPDTQTQVLNCEVDAENQPSEGVETEMTSSQDDSEILAASQVEEVSNEVEPRRSGRRRSRPLRPGESPEDQDSKNKLEKKSNDAQKSTSPKQTDIVLPGRGGRRSKVPEETGGKSGKLQGIENKDDSSQSDLQASPVATNTSLLQGRRKRKSKDSSQTELSVDNQCLLSQTDDESQTPLSQPDSQSKRKLRTRISSAGADVSGKNDQGSKGDSPTGVSENKHMDTNISDVVTKSIGRPKKARRSESADMQNISETNEEANDTSKSDSQTLLAIKKRGRPKKVLDKTNTDGDPNLLNSESSQTNEISEEKDNSQAMEKYNTRRSSQGLLDSAGNTESDASDSKDRLKKVNVHTFSEDAELHKSADKEEVPMEMSEKESEGCINVGSPHKDEVKDKEELPIAKDPNDHTVPDEKSAIEQHERKSEMEIDATKAELVDAGLDEKVVEDGAVGSSPNSMLLEKNEMKTPALFKCPHTKKRGRRRSCKCFIRSGDTLSVQNLKNAGQDLNEGELSPKSNNLPLESEQNGPKVPSEDSVADNVLCSSVLPNLTEIEMPTTITVEALKECSAMADENQNANVNDMVKDQQKDQDAATLQSTCEEQPQALVPTDASSKNDQPVEEELVAQEQSESHVDQNKELDVSTVNEERVEKEHPVEEVGGDAATPLPEESELDNDPVVDGDGENTQIDHKDQPEADQHSEAPLPPQTALSEACLDSPPKQKLSDALFGNSDVKQSPSNSVTRGVWSPAASPSTSILKKGQKRQFEDDSPSSLVKSRRVSFANPIYQQELADDIDRRSPVIRTSSPKSKIVGQPMYITTPTKGLLTLSPRNLHSPGYKSSKKCLISEMSQEPQPIPKDCVYPALVGCSTPVEAVLPQISSTMWPRGFGQLVRARNIKTVGDLSALTATDIKSLPIRSPKLSNLKKALRTYHEQQRKGRPDDLKSFDEMEKITSEPEETAAVLNEEEDKMSGEGQEVISSDMASRLEQKAESSMSVEQKADESVPMELLSDVAALGGRVTHEELSRCTPKELGLMHEHLSSMMRTIVDHLQSRLVRNLEDSLS
ncbi:telomere-associated protein RIF1 [Trichomycterus rosablanca]|uniref:telomere-associated protein RIF1 n=1 Tax=Trichomycterus rosablanca TaxID=2290929 RepID=UPI002F360291